MAFCLQDVETNGATCRRSYLHSTERSDKLIDSKRVIRWIFRIFFYILVNGTADILQVFHPENNELQQSMFLFV